MKTTTKKTTGQKFNLYMIEQLTEIIKNQKQTKELTQEVFFKKLLTTFLEINKQNKYYLKTPSVFNNAEVFFIQAAIAFKNVYPDINNSFELCQYIYNNIMLLPEYYSLSRYICMEVNASSASRYLRESGKFIK